jgi:large subunit ribosomal protein L35
MPHRAVAAVALPIKESKMPKMKTKASAKKRFRFTANGRVKAGAAGKRHGMIKRSNDFLRNARGTMILSKPDERIVKIYMPYNR